MHKGSSVDCAVQSHIAPVYVASRPDFPQPWWQKQKIVQFCQHAIRRCSCRSNCSMTVGHGVASCYGHFCCRCCVMSWPWAAHWCEASTTATGTRSWSWLKTTPRALFPASTLLTLCTILADSCWRAVPRPTSTPNCEERTVVNRLQTRRQGAGMRDICNTVDSCLPHSSVTSLHMDVIRDMCMYCLMLSHWMLYWS